MELSANWKKLKATLTAGSAEKKVGKKVAHERKNLKRKEPPSSEPASGKRPKIEKVGMDGAAATEQVNEGLSEK
jgi:hypothetical protein